MRNQATTALEVVLSARIKVLQETVRDLKKTIKTQGLMLKDKNTMIIDSYCTCSPEDRKVGETSHICFDCWKEVDPEFFKEQSIPQSSYVI